MAFPETRLTLIRRLSCGGSETDWRQFLEDYWGPICRFAMRWGGLNVADAEDVAAATFQALVQDALLARWQEQRAARLRTLLCAVTRNLISNRARVEQGRRRILAELAQQPADQLPASIWSSPEPTTEQADAFYRAWVEELLVRCVDQLFRDLHRTGKGDHFRVLYGHVCEGLSLPEISQMMDVPVTTAESRYKAARKRLAESLERAVRAHVERYTEGDAQADFQIEWAALSANLHAHGGLERALREIHERAEKTGSGGPSSRPFTAPKKITAN